MILYYFPKINLKTISTPSSWKDGSQMILSRVVKKSPENNPPDIIICFMCIDFSSYFALYSALMDLAIFPLCEGFHQNRELNSNFANVLSSCLIYEIPWQLW